MLLGSRRHPFIDGIVETPLCPGWKVLHMDKYDGNTYPDDHIHAYIPC